MFFHTHVYLAKKRTTALDSLTIIGSILPDLAITSIISWDALHKKKPIEDFTSFLTTAYPDQKSLISGIRYHNLLDYLTHITYKNELGYAYNSITPELIKLVSQALMIDEQSAQGISHNFIESAVEIYVLRANKELSEFVKDALTQTDTHQLAKILSEYFKKPEKEMFQNLTKFFSLVTTYHLDNLDAWLYLWNDLSQLFFNKDSNKEATRSALELSLTITKNTYKNFLAHAISIQKMDIVDSN